MPPAPRRQSDSSYPVARASRPQRLCLYLWASVPHPWLKASISRSSFTFHVSPSTTRTPSPPRPHLLLPRIPIHHPVDPHVPHPPLHIRPLPDHQIRPRVKPLREARVH